MRTNSAAIRFRPLRESGRVAPDQSIDAFTTEKFRGNPAGVVADAEELTVTQMQEIARELNNSETAFILPPVSTDHDVWIRFFTPATEVPSCGHATISAHYVRALENRFSSCRVMHKIGIPEDPVTGNANGPVGAYLAKHRLVEVEVDLRDSVPMN